MQDTLQPRWMHVIDTKNKTLDDIMKDMESKTRQILRKNEKCGITIREIKKDELKIFKDIMKHTSDRREFIDRPLSYYENMWKYLQEEGIIKIMLAEINFDKYKENTNKEFQSAYSTHFAGIKYAVENNYEKYNFYGITGDFKEENPLYGLYLFKKSFGGKVVELIGEFDLIINKPLYYAYKLSFNFYHKAKNIKNKLQGNK